MISDAARDQGWIEPPEEPAWLQALRPSDDECEVGRAGVAAVRDALVRARAVKRAIDEKGER